MSGEMTIAILDDDQDTIRTRRASPRSPAIT
jgi:hypothetical protein